MAYLSVFECVYILRPGKSILRIYPTEILAWVHEDAYERMSDRDFLLL